MKKFKINNTSDYMGIIIIPCVLLICTMFFIFMDSPNIFTLLLLFLSIFIFLFIIYFNGKKTVVEYNAEKIQWKYFFHSYNVRFSEISHVYCTIINKPARYGAYIPYCELVFILKNGTRLRLNDRIFTEDIDCFTEDIESLTEDDTDGIQLMLLYKFIENIYPEKSQGFIKSESEIF